MKLQYKFAACLALRYTGLSTSVYVGTILLARTFVPLLSYSARPAPLCPTIVYRTKGASSMFRSRLGFPRDVGALVRDTVTDGMISRDLDR